MRTPVLHLTALLLFCCTAAAQSPVQYTVSLADIRNQTVGVTLRMTAAAERERVHMPAWDSVYQIRDFSRTIPQMEAASGDRQLKITKIAKGSWEVAGLQPNQIFSVHYSIKANTAGSFGAELDPEHAFFNLAQVLIFSERLRSAASSITFTHVPQEWQIATVLPSRDGTFFAQTYDELVDSPFELSEFMQASFEQGGTRYHVVVDADWSEDQLSVLANDLKRITAAGVWWMQESPCADFLFIYHFPEGRGVGGMEHSCSTAIELDSQLVQSSEYVLQAMSAHEFFHLWNVKRIKPSHLSAVDRLEENYTDAFWFSEGVTDTVADYLLLRAELTDFESYLQLLAAEASALERVPARKTQSIADASIDAWLERYSDYKLPERSISYYSKGKLIGVLLDLAVRDATQGRKSLRDLMLKMNADFPHRQRTFQDSADIQRAVEELTGSGFGWFFDAYVFGTDDLPYEEFLKTIGVEVKRGTVRIAELGFRLDPEDASRIYSVVPGGPAEEAGLSAGDRIVKVETVTHVASFPALLQRAHPGETLRLRVRTAQGDSDVQLKVAAKDATIFDFEPMAQATPEQLLRRKAWVRSESQEAARGAAR